MRRCSGKANKLRHTLCKKSNGPRHLMMRIFLFSNRFPKTAYRTVQQPIPEKKTVFFENLFVLGLHLGAVKTGRVTLKNLQILTGKDFQILAHADVKRHWIGIVSNKRH